MLCLCVLCKYVNGNVYKHSVLHHKAYEFVRRLLSNIHGRMRKPSVPSATYTRALSRESARASHYVQRRSIRNIAKRKTEPELKEKVARTPGSV